MRDDFTQASKEILAKRVGYRCSNPNCRQLTCGPQENTDGIINVGVASHICAASAGGPRYDEKMSTDERKSIENGIWLCQNHAKLIDNDEKRYTKEILNKWRKLSEEAALLEMESTDKLNNKKDIEIIKAYSTFFDRPAFQHLFHQEGSMEDFDKAIEDTIIAINTGSLRSRDGTVLHNTKGKSYIENIEWRLQMNVIVELLVALRERYSFAVKTKEISIWDRGENDVYYCINDRSLSEWFDSTRCEILKMFSNICTEAGIGFVPVLPHQKIQY